MSGKDWLPAALLAAAVDRKLKAGEALFRLGDKTGGLCEIVSGRVRLARVDRSGHEIVLHVATPGETLAEASLFSANYHCLLQAPMRLCASIRSGKYLPISSAIQKHCRPFPRCSRVR
jgi:CRP-like cAMP-binding protein